MIDICRYINGIIENISGKLLAAGGDEDHVHILFALPKDKSLIDCVRTIKSNSSRWFRENYNAEFEWQKGYAAFSVSRSNVYVVSRYIRNQQEHHRQMTLQEECEKYLSGS